MYNFNHFERVAKELQKSLRKYSSVASKTDLKRWLDTIPPALSSLEDLVKNSHLSRGESRGVKLLSQAFSVVNSRFGIC